MHSGYHSTLKQLMYHVLKGSSTRTPKSPLIPWEKLETIWYNIVFHNKKLYIYIHTPYIYIYPYLHYFVSYPNYIPIHPNIFVASTSIFGLLPTHPWHVMSSSTGEPWHPPATAGSCDPCRRWTCHWAALSGLGRKTQGKTALKSGLQKKHMVETPKKWSVDDQWYIIFLDMNMVDFP